MDESHKAILGVDVGAKNTGVAFLDPVGTENWFFKTESYTNFFKILNNYIDKWQPQVIVTGKPNRYYNVISSHNRYIGILCLLAEKYQIPVVELNDTTARHVVMPDFPATKKKAFQLEFHKQHQLVDQEDAIDAYIFAKAWLLLNAPSFLG